MTGTRSTGCATCRRRKVKCGEERPSCLRCARAKLVCGGYQKNAIFIEDWRKRDLIPSRSLVEDSQKWHIGPQMTTKGLRRDHYISFLTSKLFNQRKADDMQAWYAIRLKDMPTPGLALDALVTYFYGRYNRIQEVCQQGTEYYSKALVRLRNDLQGPEAYSAGTLMTTILLSMYELIGYSNAGWIAHAGGLGRLLEARGPYSHRSGTGRSVFLDQRTLIISEAVIQRRKTFLSHPDWKTIPWSQDPESKTPFDHLMDITSDGAGYLEEAEDISPATPLIVIRDFASRLHKSLDQLDAWWRGWAVKLENNVEERHPSTELNVSYDDEGPVFAKVIKFADFWACYVTVCYNATRIMLLKLLDQTRDVAAVHGVIVENRTTEESHLPLSGITSDINLLCQEVLCSVEFFETQSKFFLGAYCLLFPFTTVQQSLVPGSRLARWLYTLPKRNLASYRRASGDQGHDSALPTCGCMMIDSIVANYDGWELLRGSRGVSTSISST